MVERTRIFVSHSSLDNPLTRRVCERIEAVAPKDRFQLLVDLETLEAGQPWPLQLHEMMADCHAALVLLTDNAVASPWVLKEATILGWRCALQADFKLFVVKFPEVTDEQLKKARYEPLQLRLLQGVAPGDPDAIGDRIVEQLLKDAPQPVATVLDEMVASVGDVLAQVGAKKLGLIAQQLGVERPRWRPGGKVIDGLVDRIACGVLRGQLGQYAGVLKLMNDLKATRLVSDDLKKLLRWVAPHWVDPEAAGQIEARPAAGAEAFRAIAIGGQQEREYTARMYVHRAFPFAFHHSIVVPTPAGAGNVLEHFTARICEFCRKQDEKRDEPLYGGMDDAQIVAELKREEAWLFVALLGRVDRLALSDLRRRFPRVRFIVNAASSDLRSAPASDLVVLMPLVDETREEPCRNDYRNALRVCEGR